MNILKDRHHHYYRLAVVLASISVVFGLLREILIVAKLGFSATNDTLQIYLSIFYSISLALDAIRLAGLNLCEKLSMQRLLLCATLIYLPFVILVSLVMCKFVGVWDWKMLGVTILGSFMNLIAGLIITLKQRFGNYIGGQFINVLPNFVLIPGILLVFAFHPQNMILALISLSVLIPIVQLLLLPFVKVKKITIEAQYGLIDSLKIFLRHLSSTSGEQLFQLSVRSASYHLGHGYLSVLAFAIRAYAAVRFILIDSYIGSKLSGWKEELATQAHRTLFIFGPAVQSVIAGFSVLVFLFPQESLFFFAGKLIWILMLSFYFMALVRVIYFKLNRLTHDSNAVWKFSLYEFLFATSCLLGLEKISFSLVFVFWLWYIVKPFAQVKFLEPRLKKVMAM